MDGKFEWIEFYSELANKLLPYKDDHDGLVGKVYQLYENTGIKMPTLESGGNLIDIDPFTVYGLFNKGLSNNSRIKIITEIKRLFDLSASIPHDFSGIPVLNNMNATFYYFKEDRDSDDIDNLWKMFDVALSYADNPGAENRSAFIEVFDTVKDLKGNRWKLTMGLYWIRPYVYINLDSRNRWFIEEPDRISVDYVSMTKGMTSVPNGDKYLKICDAFRTALKNGDYPYKTLPEFSSEAWIVSEKVNQEQKAAQKESGLSQAAFLKWFRPIIVALRDLNGSGKPAEVRNRIIQNEQLTDDDINTTRGKTKVNKFENEVAWARNYLVNAGYIDNSVSGLWKLTDAGMTVDMTEELASQIFKDAISKNKNRSKENALGDTSSDETHYWMYAAGVGSNMWNDFYQQGIMAIGWGEIGNLQDFSNKDEMQQAMKDVFGSSSSHKNAVHATWQFAFEMKPNDVIFVKRGQHEIIGCGIVTSEYRYDEERKDEFKNIRDVEWTHNGSWKYDGQIVQKTLTDITQLTENVANLKSLFEDDEMPEEPEIQYDSYSETDFLQDVFMDAFRYHKLVGVLKQKKNIILQGAPGVGKTYVAKRLAYSIMGVKDTSRVKMVQFHQSYSYEDFIMGFRPTENGFKLHTGAFYDFCKIAQDDIEKDYFFIIDEINRGNISKIFGEMFMLIEGDKRGISLGLLYKNEQFAVPENVYIIGMMNTADRSLAMLDYALRRRFAFFDFLPAFGTDSFEEYRISKNNSKFDSLIQVVKQLNDTIKNDESLGEGFCIGHSYFVTDEEITDAVLDSIVEYELIPLLREYWFDEPSKVRDWSGNLRRAIK